MNLTFKAINEKDLNYIKSIYDYYILNTFYTFHTLRISHKELKNTIEINHPTYKSYIIQLDNKNIGYCYISAFKKRQAYNRSAEITIYLEPDFTGKGIGKHILVFLEKEAKKSNIKVLVGVITANNNSSIKLFEHCGYKKCAHYKNIGEKFGQVLDVVAYQKEI